LLKAMSSEEKVEMADVPLTAAVDGEDTTKEAGVNEAGAKTKKSMFHNLFVKKQKHDALINTENDQSEHDKIPKTNCPVKKWFFCQARNCQEQADSAQSQMTIGINMLDRDEKQLNEHIKLNFEDILAEPDGYHSWDWVWRGTYHTFNTLRRFIYRFLALLFAVPCAIVWAMLFALLTSINVWILTPLAIAISIPAVWLAKTWNFIIRSLLDPFFKSCGLMRAAHNESSTNQTV
ncbi:Caveolin-1, partial [Trichinella papuae]